MNLHSVDELYLYPSLVPWHRSLRYFTHNGERTLKEEPRLEESRFANSVGYAKDRYQFKLPMPISKNEAQAAAKASAPKRNLASKPTMSMRFFDRPLSNMHTKHTNAPGAHISDMVIG